MVLGSSVIDRGLEIMSSQTKNYIIGIAASTLSIRHLAVRTNTGLPRNRDEVRFGRHIYPRIVFQ